MKSIVTFLLALFFALPTLAGPIVQSLQGVNVVSGKNTAITFPTDKPVAIVFVSAKCPCSASHEALIKDLSEKHPEVQFLAIHSNADETVQDAATHFKSVVWSFAVIRDEKNTYANELGALKTPHAFVLDKEGQLLYHGGVTDSHVGPSAKKHYLKEVLEDLQAGKKPRHKEGRALGCYITRENS